MLATSQIMVILGRESARTAETIDYEIDGLESSWNNPCGRFLVRVHSALSSVLLPELRPLAKGGDFPCKWGDCHRASVSLLGEVGPRLENVTLSRQV